MKIKYDFISNSSSTSFVYISNTELTLEKFLEAAGVDNSSPLNDLFTEWYRILSTKIKNGEQISNKTELDKYIKDNSPCIADKTIKQLTKALEIDKKIIHAILSSDDGMHESFLCCEIFEIESEDFILSAYESYW